MKNLYRIGYFRVLEDQKVVWTTCSSCKLAFVSVLKRSHPILVLWSLCSPWVKSDKYKVSKKSTHLVWRVVVSREKSSLELLVTLSSGAAMVAVSMGTLTLAIGELIGSVTRGAEDRRSHAGHPFTSGEGVRGCGTCSTSIFPTAAPKLLKTVGDETNLWVLPGPQFGGWNLRWNFPPGGSCYAAWKEFLCCYLDNVNSTHPRVFQILMKVCSTNLRVTVIPLGFHSFWTAPVARQRKVRVLQNTLKWWGCSLQVQVWVLSSLECCRYSHRFSTMLLQNACL